MKESIYELDHRKVIWTGIVRIKDDKFEFNGNQFVYKDLDPWCGKGFQVSVNKNFQSNGTSWKTRTQAPTF